MVHLEDAVFTKLLTYTSIVILLPGVFSKPGDSKFRLPADACGDKVLCENLPNYPHEEVTSAVKPEEDKHKQWFGKDPEFLEEKIMSRQGGTEIQLCTSKTQIIYPEAGRNSAGVMRMIVNDGKEYRQGLRVETCFRQDSECDFANAFPSGYRTKCVQKYIHRQMVAMDENGQVTTDYFSIPSCCSCAVIVV